MLVTYGGLNNGYMGQLAFEYSASVIRYRTRNGDNSTWGGWATLATAAAVEGMRLQIKREIYAELVALNAGIVIPAAIE